MRYQIDCQANRTIPRQQKECERVLRHMQAACAGFLNTGAP
jgi:hypothetical protein